MKRFKLKNGYTLAVGKYQCNKNATALVLEKDGQQMYTASVYLQELDMMYMEDIVAIKTYSENEGIEKLLEEVLDERLGFIQTGFVEVPLYRIKHEFIEA